LHRSSLRVIGQTTNLIEICGAIDASDTVTELVIILDDAGLNVDAIVDLLDCLGIGITFGEGNAIIGL